MLVVTIPTRKELRDFVIKLKQNGLKIAPILGLILGRYLEQFKDQDEAMLAVMCLYGDWKSKHPVMEQIEVESMPITEFVSPAPESTPVSAETTENLELQNS